MTDKMTKQLQETIKTEVENLKKRKSELLDELNKIDNKISSFQNICTHKDENGKSLFKQVGYDSHKTYYKCSICGYEYDE